MVIIRKEEVVVMQIEMNQIKLFLSSTTEVQLHEKKIYNIDIVIIT